MLISHFFEAYHHKVHASFCEVLPVQKYYDPSQPEIGGFFVKFMEGKYLLDEPKKRFVRLKPDVRFELSEIKEVVARLNHDLFDKNVLLIPIRKFTDVLREELMQPFSFFQMYVGEIE